MHWRKTPGIFLTLAMMLAPSVALANTGTPLMWASVMHLLFGNALIGIVEGLLLAWFFKTPRWKSIGALILANYLSAWIGYYVFSVGVLGVPDMTIENLRGWFALFVAGAFVVTWLVEGPFFWLLMRKQAGSLWRVLKATLIVNGVTYVLLFGWYESVSPRSILTELRVVSADELKPVVRYALYFIDAENGHVVRCDLTDRSQQRIQAVSSQHWEDRLFVRTNSSGGKDLYVALMEEDGALSRDILVVEKLLPGGAKAEESDWEVSAGFWPDEGISGENKKTGEHFRFALESPFVAWKVRSVTPLNGGLIVFQLGKTQICILDPHTKKIALLARGKSPIIVKQAEVE